MRISIKFSLNLKANFDTNEEKPWNYPNNLPPWNLKCPTDNKFDNPPYLPIGKYHKYNT